MQNNTLVIKRSNLTYRSSQSSKKVYNDVT